MCFFVFLICVSEPASLCSPSLSRLPARHGRGVRGSAREIFHELPDAYRNGDGKHCEDGDYYVFCKNRLACVFRAQRLAATLELMAGLEPATSSLPRYNPKQKGHCPPQYTPFKSPKHHNILCFFFPEISLAVNPFTNLTAKYSQSRFHAVFPRFFPPFKLPVSVCISGYCKSYTVAVNGNANFMELISCQ